ncbi:MAG: gamma-glutamyltransferase family protein [Geminicoccaceae bacterium]|nr:MAG: gamma-glutamyltransferase family protein [Geminicoccaceae bacterium]
MRPFDPAQPYPSRRSPVLAENVVATSQPLAARAGLDALAGGGNAVDAALAAAITLTVVEPTGNGLGSDAFAILWDGERLVGLNASGRAPRAWTAERFAGAERMPVLGADAVTVPGAVSAWVALSERYGKLPFERLFEPAIRYAESGYLVSPIIASLWQRSKERLEAQPGFAEAFLPNGRAPLAGERFRLPAMAASLQAIASSRGEAFYRGALAEQMVAWVQAHGGGLAVEDLAEHRADWVEPLARSGFGCTLHEIPPNGQGIAAQMALGILTHTAIADLEVDSVRALHLQLEAMKLAFADLDAHVADAAAMRFSAERLLDDAYLAARARLIDPARAGEPVHGVPGPGGTVYLAAADASGMMVSYIQSNYMGFGSGVVVPGTGISLQNRGAGFTLEAGHPNAVAPFKRPFHTIIPGFLSEPDGSPAMAFGVMGGPMQAQGHLQMLLRTRLWGQNVQAASDAPRWRLLGGRGVAMEPGLPASTYQGLEALGHEVVIEAPDEAFGFGGAQLIAKLDDGYVAGSDSRKDGQAVGF